MVTGNAIMQAAALTIPLNPTKFNSGSEGFRGQGKVLDGDTRYQVQVIAVRIGSKPKGKVNTKKASKH